MKERKPLVFAHIGDLHITNSKERNYLDLLSISAQLEIEFGHSLDFVFLPGDIADHGQAHQYTLVRTALKMLSVPVHAIAGDHDMEQGSLHHFYTYLNATKLPYAVTIRGHKCIFLDVNGPGSGGPDFCLGSGQLDWLENELAGTTGEDLLLFMHTYPDDLKDAAEKQRLLQLIETHKVLLVDMGHTHYNELANDGTTLYAATRSTGQIEEGPVGYSVIGVDEGVVSWRFRALDDGFPFVLITSPADHRLQREGRASPSPTIAVRALVFGDRPVAKVICWIDENESVEMLEQEGVWIATIPSTDDGDHVLTVEAVDSSGRPGRHRIEICSAIKEAKRMKTGSDLASIGAWSDNGIFGTQLGPNRNAKPLK